MINSRIRSKCRLTLVAGFLCLLALGLGISGAASLYTDNSSLKAAYENRLVRIGYLQQIFVLLIESQSNVAKSLASEPASAERKMDEVERSTGELASIWKIYTAAPLLPGEKELAGKFITHYQRFLNDGMHIGMRAIRVRDIGKATEVVDGPMTELFVPVRDSINALIKLQMDFSQREYEQAQRRHMLVCNFFLGALGIGIFAGASVFRSLIQAVSVKQAGIGRANDASPGVAVINRAVLRMDRFTHPSARMRRDFGADWGNF